MQDTEGKGLGHVTESIWANGTVIIPMAEVSHIEKDEANHNHLGGWWIIFKHSKTSEHPKFKRQPLEPNI
jgi:hypothetical protein